MIVGRVEHLSEVHFDGYPTGVWCLLRVLFVGFVILINRLFESLEHVSHSAPMDRLTLKASSVLEKLA